VAGPARVRLLRTMNPWTEIPLNDYEGHMAFPAVGQAAMLAEEFGKAIAATRPKSVALLGCAGGNGLDALRGADVERVVCVDINAAYLEVLERRYRREIPGLECHASEVEGFRSHTPVDLVFGGLIFEFTRLEEAVESVSLLLAPKGLFCALLQLPAAGLSTVSPSPHAQSLARVIGFFQYVGPGRLAELCERKALALIEQRVIQLDSGKSFAVVRFARTGNALPQALCQGMVMR
jgi:hypothetical protein